MSNIDTRIRDMFNAQRNQAFDKTLDDALSHGGPGGTSGGMTDDWKVSVDRQLAQLHGDVRALLAALIVGFLILGGAGWTVYSSLSAQISEARVADEKAAGAAAERNAVISGKLDVINERLPTKNR